MPKSKKKKNQDFQKVKLKVGKKLSKGDNVTNLSFKTRQIQLTQRIKADDGKEPVTKKKLSIQDLLRQCDHHSSSARVNAVFGLKELWLNNYKDLMVPTNIHGYGEILKKLATLLIDNEAVVRHSVINLFKLILNKLSPKTSGEHGDKLGGNLYSHIHAFLCCAMNHVHEDIKLDALVLFDTLLDTFPHLMVQQTGDLLKNLVGLISSPAFLGAKGDSTTQRLSLNPDSKLPAMKFRAKVLLRMKRTFMEALGDYNKDSLFAKSDGENSKQRTWSLHSDHQGSNVKQDTRLVKDSIFGRMFLGASHELDDYITKPSSLESFVTLSMPVLLQGWREARAHVESYVAADDLVSVDSLEVMSLVACVIQLMFVLCAKPQRKTLAPHSNHHLVAPEFLVKNYQQDLEKLLMGNFPYSVQEQSHEMSRKKKKKNTHSLDRAASQASLLALNLAVCDIMSSFCRDHTFRPKKFWLKKIGDHLMKFLKKSASVEQSQILIRVIKNIFSNPHASGDFIRCYKAALQYYKSCSTKMPQKKMFYNLFTFMGKTWSGWNRENQELQSDVAAVLNEFFQSLPELLLELVKLGGKTIWMKDILTLMSYGCVQKYSQSFSQSFFEKLTEMLDPQDGVLACDDEHVQQRFCFLLSFGVPLTRDHLKQLLSSIRRPIDKPVLHRRKSWSVVSHAVYSIIANIRERVPLASQLEFNQMTSDQHSQLSDYLKFMFSLQLGFTEEELNGLSEKTPVCSLSNCWLDVDFTVESDQWERHVEIANLVSGEIVNFHLPVLPSQGYEYAFSFLGNFELLWKQALSNRSKVHILSAYSLIQLLYHASLPHAAEKPSLDFYRLVSYILTSVLTSLYCKDKTEFRPNEEMVWQIKSDIIQCLALDSPLLALVMGHLEERSQGAYGAKEDDKQASKTAQDFLLSDDTLKDRVVAIAERIRATCSNMEIS